MSQWYGHQHRHSHGYDADHRHQHQHNRANFHRAISVEGGGELSPKHQHSHRGDTATPVRQRTVRREETQDEKKFLNHVAMVMGDDGNSSTKDLAKAMRVSKDRVLQAAGSLGMLSYVKE